MTFQLSQIPSTSHHGSNFAENSKADLYVENDFCVVDPCHKQDYLRCEPLEGENLVEDLLCEKHHLSGSLKEDREKLRESMNNFVDTNALVTRCCWKYLVGSWKENPFWKSAKHLKKAWSR